MFGQYNRLGMSVKNWYFRIKLLSASVIVYYSHQGIYEARHKESVLRMETEEEERQAPQRIQVGVLKVGLKQEVE